MAKRKVPNGGHAEVHTGGQLRVRPAFAVSIRNFWSASVGLAAFESLHKEISLPLGIRRGYGPTRPSRERDVFQCTSEVRDALRRRRRQ